MSNYYEYKGVKVMIAHRLMAMEGWKVYGYKEDESDSMTDYYNPANWDGIAEKNGYILVVDKKYKRESEEIRKYNRTSYVADNKTKVTIKKLEAMTEDRGASKQEEQTAKAKIEILKNKNIENNTNVSTYDVIGIRPGHEANPNRCNWHIEKDGVIILKGTGLLKYSSIKYESNFKKQTEKEIREEITRRNQGLSWFNETELEKSVIYQLERQAETEKLTNGFNELINKIDTSCGGILGTGDLVTYEKVIITEYKKENKAVETTIGEVKEGQCFILKSSFNYGCYSGLVYRIHESEHEGKKYYHAYKLNGKLTKECTGKATQNNRWNTLGSQFNQWIEKGAISWCEIQEVKTPYEVEKVVKKSIKAPKTTKENSNQNTPDSTETIEEINLDNLTFEISEDTDTRDNSKIYVVKIVESLDREEYKKVNTYINSIGGYYSRFKHGFIFKENPAELLNNSSTTPESNTQPQETAEIIIDYSTEIIEKLGLTPSEYATNSEYLSLLSDKISHLKIDNNVIDCIKYEGLKQALTTILNSSNKDNIKQDIKQTEQEQKQEPPKQPIEYEIEESKSTDNKNQVWLVKIKSNLSKDEFTEIKRNFATLKGFYSSFNNSFIFKYNPTDKLKITA